MVVPARQFQVPKDHIEVPLVVEEHWLFPCLCCSCLCSCLCLFDSGSHFSWETWEIADNGRSIDPILAPKYCRRPSKQNSSAADSGHEVGEQKSDLDSPIELHIRGNC